MRPSPTESATWYDPGTYKRGNDGNMYGIMVTQGGIHRWTQVPYNNIAESDIYSTKHPAFGSLSKPANPSTSHKFKVGDKVRVIKSGSGCALEEIGTEVIITELGQYAHQGDGYRVNPPIGNSKSGTYGGFIGEESFELVPPPPIIKQTQTVKKPVKMARTKSITKRTAKEVRNIQTSLINKEEVFKMLALAEATGLPLLLIGEPGVAKTKTVIEYAKAWLNKDGKMTAESFQNKMFVLETDEGTKASEVKGMPDLGKLFQDNKYELSTPIADAEIVVINEVDKASSAIRNAMLGVMNEKFLFNGKHKTPCKWKLFVATCNEIPKDEKDSPFWDRFMLKMTVNRVSAGEMVKYYNKGGRDYKETFNISIPNKDEIMSIDIPVKKLEKYLEVGYQNSSDRTLTFVPTLTKAISFIWDNSIDKALVKTAQIMIGPSAGTELSNKLHTAEHKAVMSKIDMMRSYSTNEQLELAVAEIESLINTYASRGILDETDIQEFETLIQVNLDQHPARVDYVSAEDFDKMLD